MKKTIILIFLCVSFVLNGATYYVAPNGNDSYSGAFNQPWASWQKGFSSLAPGDILYIRGGNYTIMYGSGHGVNISNRDGSGSNKITVMSYPGETPVLDCTGLSASAGVNYGILMSGCDYWSVKGLTVKNVREYRNLSKSAGGSPTSGWELSNCNNINLELCNVTLCGNGFTLNGTLNNITYLNCDAYMNFDYYDSGGLANGFNGNIRGSSTVFYKGCRSWSNSDDGYDNFGGAGFMTYNDCWAWRNGKDVPTIGNGDGFKLGCDLSGTELSGNQRILYNCISVDNYLMGFDESMDVSTSMDMALYNCFAYKNTRDFGFRFHKAIGTGKTTLRNNISYGNNVNYEGRPRNVSDHNTWNTGGPVVTDADFESLDMTQLTRARKPDGSLPDITFTRLKPESDLIDAGITIGIPFSGVAPDLGSLETQKGSSIPAPAIVTYLNSKVDNSTPGIITATYSSTLSGITPPVTSFIVRVNSVTKTISKLAISGTNVLLTLSSPVAYGDLITIEYIKPATNPLQCMASTQAINLSASSVLNGVEPKGPFTSYAQNTIGSNISVYPNPVREYFTIANPDGIEGQTIKIFDLSGRLCLEQRLESGLSLKIPVNLERGIYIINVMSGSVIQFVRKLIVV